MWADTLCQQSSGLGPALSRMWCTSRMLMAVASATSTPGFQLPDRLGCEAPCDAVGQDAPYGGPLCTHSMHSVEGAVCLFHIDIHVLL